jgi:uncharacterized protein YodC (DUF2158 family)
MSEGSFKIGDVVRLKSGGPSMTVSRLAMDTENRPCVETVWLTASGKESRGTFSEEWLEADEFA